MCCGLQLDHRLWWWGVASHPTRPPSVIFCGLSAVSSAFELNFAGNLGGTLNPGTFPINVPIYGDVMFEAVSGTLTVVDAFENIAVKAQEFATGDRVKISFLGLKPMQLAQGLACLHCRKNEGNSGLQPRWSRHLGSQGDRDAHQNDPVADLDELAVGAGVGRGDFEALDLRQVECRFHFADLAADEFAVELGFFGVRPGDTSGNLDLDGIAPGVSFLHRQDRNVGAGFILGRWRPDRRRFIGRA